MKLYRTGKVAEMLGVHKVTVIRWIKQGKIRAVRIGKEFRVPEDEVKRLLGGKRERHKYSGNLCESEFIGSEKRLREADRIFKGVLFS